MLRADKNAEFVRLPWSLSRLFSGRYAVRIGKQIPEIRFTKAWLERASAAQLDHPVELFTLARRTYWWFHDQIYWDDDGLTAVDVKALLLDRERRLRRQLDRAHALMASDEPATAGPPNGHREGIPQEVKRRVWEACAGRCVECGSAQLLEFDHIIPLAMGGANSERNLQLLCAECNRCKGAAL